MKFLVLLLIAPMFSFSQSYKEEREAKKAFMKIADTCSFPVPFAFTYIDTVSLNKHLIYSKVSEWFATNSTNYNKTRQMQDSSLGKIVLPDITSAYGADYRYTITVDAREGKYRIIFSDFYQLKDYPYQIRTPIDSIEKSKGIYLGPGTKRQYWQAEKLHLQQETALIFSSLKGFVRKKDDF